MLINIGAKKAKDLSVLQSPILKAKLSSVLLLFAWI